MRKIVPAILITILATFIADPASAKDRVESVIIKNQQRTVILKTSPAAAKRIRTMLKSSNRVVIRTRPRETPSVYYYSDDYYPYYRNKGMSYSLGHATGRSVAR